MQRDHLRRARPPERPAAARASRPTPSAAAALALQRTVGNRRTAELLGAGRPLLQRNPVAAAGAIEVIGNLSQTASVIGDAYAGSQGQLTYSSPTAQRLSDGMTQPREHNYKVPCLSLVNKLGTMADAYFNVEWEGNSYGEIGAARVRLDLDRSDFFQFSSATVQFDVLNNLIQPGGDRRTWQMGWSYEGTYDTFSSGYLQFQGSFAIDAFGNFVSLEHTVKDLSTPANPDISAEPGFDLELPIPPVPADAGKAAPRAAPGSPGAEGY